MVDINKSEYKLSHCGGSLFVNEVYQKYIFSVSEHVFKFQFRPAKEIEVLLYGS